MTLSIRAGQCWSCQPNAVLIWTWLRYTPEFTVSVTVLSAPVSMIIALWGMLSKHDRQLLFGRVCGARDTPGQAVALLPQQLRNSDVQRRSGCCSCPFSCIPSARRLEPSLLGSKCRLWWLVAAASDCSWTMSCKALKEQGAPPERRRSTRVLLTALVKEQAFE